MTIVNNTISNNSAINGGALCCSDYSSPVLHNNILWGNTADSGSQVYLYDESSDPDFYYCSVQGGTSAFGLNNCFYIGVYQNNIDADPLFVLPSAGSGSNYSGATANWCLQSGSPCIDEGTPDTTGLNLPATDIASSPRIINGRVDIGAYEYLTLGVSEASEPYSEIIIYPNPLILGSIDQITIYGLQVSGYKFVLYDMVGRVVKQSVFNSQQMTIEKGDLQTGMYFYQIERSKIHFIDRTDSQGSILGKGKIIIK